MSHSLDSWAWSRARGVVSLGELPEGNTGPARACEGMRISSPEPAKAMPVHEMRAEGRKQHVSAWILGRTWRALRVANVAAPE